MHTPQKYGFEQRNIRGKRDSLGPGLFMLSRKVPDNFNLSHLAESILKDLFKKQKVLQHEDELLMPVFRYQSIF
jgi:hypothetical protein